MLFCCEARDVFLSPAMMTEFSFLGELKALSFPKV